MSESVSIILQVFGLIAVGYLARRSGLVTERAGDGISEFVVALAVPCLILRTLGRAEIPDVQPWGYWISYFLGVAFTWTLIQTVARRFFGLGPTAAVVAGFSAAQANTVLVGIPIILKVYGQEGAVPLFLLIAIHLPLMIATATVLVEGRRASPLKILRRLVGHPIIVAILAGGVLRLVPAAVPGPVWSMIDLIASAAVPCSLITMGIALRHYGLEAGWRLPAVITTAKLVIHPLAVLILATQVFDLPAAWAGVAVLFAACPTGINAYLFAEQHREGVALASSAVTMSTAVSLVTVFVWLQVLGVG